MKRLLFLFLCLTLLLSLFTACSSKPVDTPSTPAESTSSPAEPSSEPSAPTPAESGTSEGVESVPAESGEEGKVSGGVASADDMTTVEEVVEEGMVPVYAESLLDGRYPVDMKSSSSMFKVEHSELIVENGRMNAVLYMTSSAYPYLYAGTAEEAAAADSTDYIPLTENSDGSSSFTLPIEALDAGVSCAAYSKRKELWYDRTLLFRADSLPLDAFAAGVIVTPETLALADGSYTVEVSLSGGSGKASVVSPAEMYVENNVCTARIEWGSSNYDYMKVEEVKYLPVNTEGHSTFLIPITAFDYNMPVLADTTAMSTPHEIEYSLRFASASIQRTGELPAASVEVSEPASSETASESAKEETGSESGASGKTEEQSSAPAQPEEEAGSEESGDRNEEAAGSGEGGEEPAPVSSGPADGTYQIDLTFSGGSGKAYITSPVTMKVENGHYTAVLVWSSVNYDYMIVDGVKYQNENNGGKSTFTVPISALDTDLTVIGDTLAMSSPHEIEYTIRFDSGSMKAVSG